MEIVKKNLFKPYKNQRKTMAQFFGKCEVHLRNYDQKKGREDLRIH